MGKYTAEYDRIHASKEYGKSSEKMAHIIKTFRPAGATSILDYGAGQSNTANMLGNFNHIKQYDPSVEGRKDKPEGNYDWVICTDVLEHIPEEELDDVLADIFSYSKFILLVIATVPAGERLSTGENAHCTVQTPEWWDARLSKFTSVLNPVLSLTEEWRYGVKTY